MQAAGGILGIAVIVAAWLAAVAIPGTPWARWTRVPEDRMLITAGVVALGLWLVAWLIGEALPGAAAPPAIALVCMAVFAMPFAVAAIIIVRLRAAPARRDYGRAIAPALAAFCAAYLIAIGFGILWTGPGAILELQMFRYLVMPGDNLIPVIFANGLRAGEVPVPLMGDWFSADRPPLQTGLLLIFGKAIEKGLRVSLYNADGYVSVACQALFMIAVVRFGRSLTGRTSAGVVGALAAALVPATGLYLFFPWPKLLASAFLLTAAALTVDMLRSGQMRRNALVSSAALWAASIALALLSHGSALFGAIPLTLVFAVAVVRASGGVRKAVRPLATVALTFAAVYGPWIAYGRITGEDKGRLIKWHFAGDPSPSDRSTFSVLRDAYANVGFDAWLDGRRANLRRLVGNPEIPVSLERLWPTFTDTTLWRVLEFHSLLYATLIAALWIPAVLCLFAVRRRGVGPAAWATLLVIGWLMATLAIWCLLLFARDSTLPHQGPAIAIFLPSALLAILAARMSLTVAVVMLAIQATAFAFVMVSPNSIRALDLTTAYRPSTTAVALLAAAIAIAAAAVALGRRADRLSGSSPSG